MNLLKVSPKKKLYSRITLDNTLLNCKINCQDTNKNVRKRSIWFKLTYLLSNFSLMSSFLTMKTLTNLFLFMSIAVNDSTKNLEAKIK